MATRLTRPQQVERNRRLLLDAALEVFTEAGYARATLDAIAERAGFSKGVVYSQFESKADLFLVLLERRIVDRAEQNRSLVEGLTPGDAVAALLSFADRDAAEHPAWQLVLVEFRAQATRDPALNARYAELHSRTVDQLAEMLSAFYDRADAAPPASPRLLAEFVLAAGTGLILERAARADALPTPDMLATVARALQLEKRTR